MVIRDLSEFLRTLRRSRLHRASAAAEADIAPRFSALIGAGEGGTLNPEILRLARGRRCCRIIASR